VYSVLQCTQKYVFCMLGPSRFEDEELIVSVELEIYSDFQHGKLSWKFILTSVELEIYSDLRHILSILFRVLSRLV